ncbi:hypothetical protein GGI12_004324, partial [Dipsacomyces acuminosporus]
TAMQRLHGNRYKEWRDIHVQSLTRVDSILREAVGLGSSSVHRSVSVRTVSSLPEHTSGLGISMPPSADSMPGRRGIDIQQLNIEASRRPVTASGPLGKMNAQTPSLANPANQRSASRGPACSRPSTSTAYASRAPPLASRPTTGQSLFNAPTQQTAMPLARPYTSYTGKSSHGHRNMSIYAGHVSTNASHRRLTSLHAMPTARRFLLSRDEDRRSRLFAEYESLIKNDLYDDDEEEEDEPFYTPTEDKQFPLAGKENEPKGGAEETVTPASSKHEDRLISDKGAAAGSNLDSLFAAHADGSNTVSAFTNSLYQRRPVTVQHRSHTLPRHLRDARASSACPPPSVFDAFAREQPERIWSRLSEEKQHLFSPQSMPSQIDTHIDHMERSDLFATREQDEEPTANLLPVPASKLSMVTAASAAVGVPSPDSLTSMASTTPAPSPLPQADAAAVDTHSSKTAAAAADNGSDRAKILTRSSTTSSEYKSCLGSVRSSIHINTEDIFANTLFADEKPLDKHEKMEGTMQSIGAVSQVNADREQERWSVNGRGAANEPSNFILAESMNKKLDSLSIDSQHLATPEYHEEEERDGESKHTVRSSRAALELPTSSIEDVRRQLRYLETLVPATELGSALAKGGNEHKELLNAYMKRFDFRQQPIDFALRQLLQKLHLPKESQQIDRVIVSFAECYDACNPGLYYSSDVVYSYTFAIILLHTDAHNPKVKQKITKAQFISRAKLLDEHSAEAGSRAPSLSGDGEMFDEVLDILYDNTTAAKFEYAPSSADGLDEHVAASIMTRPNTSHGEMAYSDGGTPGFSRRASTEPIELSLEPQGSGLSGWFKRIVFLPPIDTLAGSLLGGGVGDTARDSADNFGGLGGSKSQQSVRTPIANAHQIPEPKSPLLRSERRDGQVDGESQDYPQVPGPKSPHNQPSSPRHAAGPSGFATSDIAVPAQPLMVESIKLSGVKQHVKRRVSLRQGRPLSGIIYESQMPHAIKKQQASQSSSSQLHHGSSSLAQSSGTLAGMNSPPKNSDKAFLRVDMAGRVSRKMERLDNGRRGLVRRWKEIWMVLSGSRLYFFRINDAAAHSEHHHHQGASSAQANAATSKPPMSIQTIIPLRHGVAIVDSAYNKYPHVFRILAGDGSQILIKAPSDDAVAEWMARINCAAAFKTMEIDRRVLDSPAPGEGEGDRMELLENRLAALDKRLAKIDDKLERNLRLFKQLATLSPLTRQARARLVQHAQTAKDRLKDLYLVEQRLTCYKDVLELDLVIEYELASHQMMLGNEQANEGDGADADADAEADEY